MQSKISGMVVVLSVFSLLAADATLAQPSPPPIPDWLKKVIPGQNQPAGAGAAPPPASVNTNGTNAAASTGKPPPNAALFQQGSANGEELKYVLEEIVLAARQSQSRSGLAAFANGGTVPLSAAPSLDPRVLVKKLPDTGRYLARSATVSYSDKLLSRYITSMTEDDAALSNERVTLPANGASLKPEQQQRLLVIGAMVIASRISSATLEKARRNFDAIRAQYATVLQQRQMAAEFLASVVDKRRQALAAKNELQARNLQGDLTAEDLTFIDSFGPDITVETFSNDVGLQNMALKYLRKSDPAAYNSYTVNKEAWVNSSKAYLQTMSGVSAFGGFCVLFLKQVSDALHQRDLAEIAAEAPLAAEFIKDAGPLMLLSGDTLYAGFVLTPNEARRTYRLEHAGIQTEFNNAPEVFKALSDANDKRYLDDAVFRNEAPGFVSRVYQCDIAEAGNLLDDVVPAADRKRFGEGFMNRHEDGAFSFADSLLDDGSASDSRHLAESLLNRDQRTSAEFAPIGEIQRVAIANDATWGNTQVMRLVLANSDGAYAQMQLGGTIIRLIPSMATIYAYESYANVCLKTAGQDGSPAAPKDTGKKAAKKTPGNSRP
jgi:hypothetical protein